MNSKVIKQIKSDPSDCIQLLNMWDAKEENLLFISTNDQSIHISELKIKAYSQPLQRAFFKQFKIREIFQLRDKITKEDLIENRSIFLSKFIYYLLFII